MDAPAYITGGASMNRNLLTVTLTLVVLGLVATFDIIPGAGFYAGIVMLAIGATAFTVQLIGQTTPLLGPRASPRANVASP
jgi:hypothetical protein